MLRLWPFRSKQNLLITVTGVCMLGIYANRIYSQKDFNHPIINEAVKSLSKNQKIKQIVGYPLSYKGAFTNSCVQKGKEVYYSFKVEGPRATIEVQMNTSCKNPQKIGKQAQTIVQQIRQIQNQLSELNRKMLQKREINENHILKSEQKLKQSQLVNKLTMLKIKQQEDKIALQKYYVPSPNLYNDIMGNRIENLPPQTQLWGIQSIVVSFPNRSRLTIFDSQAEKRKGSLQNDQDNKSKPVNINQINLVSPPNPKYIKQRLTQTINLSSQQIQQYSKNKSNLMYTKYGPHRMMMAFFIFIAGGMALVYFFLNRHKSLAGSVLLNIVQKQFINNPKIIAFISQRQGTHLHWNTKLVGGGQKGYNFNCQVDVKGVIGGKAIFNGTYNAKTQILKMEKFIFEYRDKQNKKQKIDLLS